MTDATTSGHDDEQLAQAIPLREEVSGDAQRLTQTAKTRIDQAAEGQKAAVTGAAHKASSALDRAVEELRKDDGAPDWLTKAFETTARQIEGLARSVEGKNIDDVRRNVTQFARTNPMAFLAASAAAGFAAARFLRAGSEYKSHQPNASEQMASRQSPATGDGSSTGFASADTPIYSARTTPGFTS